MKKLLYRGVKYKIYKGDMFGRLMAVSCSSESGRRVVKLKCVCGNTVLSDAYSIISGNTKSCGCLFSDIVRANLRSGIYTRKHGMRYTKVYRAWRSMIDRCKNRKNNSYKNYGGRGITVSKSWLDFNAFFLDMGNPPSSDYSLDRIDVNGDYSKSNCRWATKREQSNNRRNNNRIKWRGEVKTITEWESFLGFKKSTISARLLSGWSVEEALSEPLDLVKSKNSNRRVDI